MVVRDVKEEEVVNRITKMAAKLHFSGDRSSILGMKVSADLTNWGNMDDNKEKLTAKFADIGVYQFSWNFLQRGCDTTMNSLTSLVFFSRLFSPSKVSSTTNSHVLNVVTYVGNMEKKRYGIWSRQFMSNFDITIFSLEWIRM